MSEGLDIISLGNRGILRGVQCICGQWWPDFVRTEHTLQFRTECCGSVYSYTTGAGAKSTLSLLTNNTASAEAEQHISAAPTKNRCQLSFPHPAHDCCDGSPAHTRGGARP